MIEYIINNNMQPVSQSSPLANIVISPIMDSITSPEIYQTLVSTIKSHMQSALEQEAKDETKNQQPQTQTQLETTMKVILQISRQNLSQAFQLTSALRKEFKNCPIQFYTLYDSMKKPCCTDIIGARHVEPYHLLFHFGYACFSERYDPRHYFVLPEKQQQWPNMEQILLSSEFCQVIQNKQISTILVDQSLYRRVKDKLKELIETVGLIESAEKEEKLSLEMAKLPFDVSSQQQSYFGFSYYLPNSHRQAQKNILVIKPDTTEQESDESEPTAQMLLQNLMLTKKSLRVNEIYVSTPSSPFPELWQKNENKRMMQRLSQIAELEKYSTFGILVSNPSTQFCQSQIRRCRALLNARKARHFTFMMNNLNECKLGNFPEIEVYVVISCYNYSLYSMRDFYRLVVSPADLEVAFGGTDFQEYQFDLGSKSDENDTKEEQKQQKMEEKIVHSLPQQSSLATMSENAITVSNAIQTIDYYRNRQYKGLDFSEKKEIKKISKGKIGIAEKYEKLQ